LVQWALLVLLEIMPVELRGQLHLVRMLRPMVAVVVLEVQLQQLPD
jgi:hypothetical protein